MQNPKPFFYNRKKIKTFVLGADPTNFSDGGKPKQIEYVFGILSDEPRYFSSILKNLNLVGLHLEDVYVQNLVQEYLQDETSKNKNWEDYAVYWLKKLKKEFDEVNPKKNIPVLVTAERILKFLVNRDVKLPAASIIYSNNADSLFYVKPNDNKLGRTLFAFYRHPAYSLKFKNQYRTLLAEWFT
jgi:hypothetical protein